MRYQTVRTVGRFELLGWRREPPTLLGLGIWVAVLVVAAVNGVQGARADAAVRARLLAQDRTRYADWAARADASTRTLDGRAIDPLTRWVQHGPTHPIWLGESWGPRRALRPVSPLGALLAGNVDTAARAYVVSTDAVVELTRNSTQTEHPLRQLLGRLDLGFLALYCLPLVLCAWGADLMAGDIESGRLRLIEAQGVSPAVVFSVRWMVRSAAVMAPMCAAIVAVGVAASGGQPWWMARAGAWMVAVVAYGALWMGMVFAVASAGRSAGVTAAILSGGWSVLCLLLPAGVQTAAAVVAPLPSRAAFFSAYRAAEAEASRLPPATVLAAYFAAHPDVARRYGAIVGRSEFPLASPESSVFAEARQQYIAARLEPVARVYDEARERQRRLIQRLSILSPMTLTYEALTTLADTGDAAQACFERSVRELHARWRAFFLPRAFEMMPLTGADYARLPELEDRRPGRGPGELRGPAGAMVLLGALAAAITSGGWRRLRRLT